MIVGPALEVLAIMDGERGHQFVAIAALVAHPEDGVGGTRMKSIAPFTHLVGPGTLAPPSFHLFFRRPGALKPQLLPDSIPLGLPRWNATTQWLHAPFPLSRHQLSQ